jgi:secreted trypsin-like serine protease
MFVNNFPTACGLEYPDTSAIFRAIAMKKVKSQNKEQYYYYPWIVRLMKVTQVSSASISASTICAGTLMNKQYILTAASCVYEWQKYIYTKTHPKCI